MQSSSSSPGGGAGFEARVRSLPVPAPLLGSLLAEIDDIAELKCTLRFLWYAAQVKGSPKAVPTATMEADGVLATALGSTDEVRRGLRLACARGTLLEAAGRYLLNTPENRRAAARLTPENASAPGAQAPPPEPVVVERSSVFALYEANVGMLTPMVAEQLRDAEDTYPSEWIEAAIREATERNARSWRYIATILERWASEGRGKKGHGEPGRHPETLTAADLLRRRRPPG